MDTALVTKQLRVSQWAEIIQDRINSGMKINDYCETHGISRSAYFYWLKKVRAQALASQNIQFADITSVYAPDAGMTAAFKCAAAAPVSIIAGGITVAVNETASYELVKKVLRAVNDAS